MKPYLSFRHILNFLLCCCMLAAFVTVQTIAEEPAGPDFSGRGSRLADLSADGEVFAVANSGGRILCGRTGAGSAVRTFYICEPRAIALSADGRLLAAAGKGAGLPPGIKVWDVQEGKLLHAIPAEVTNDTLLRFSPDSRRLVSTSPGFLALWDLLTGSQLDTYSSRERISHIYFRPSETTFFNTLSSDGKSRSYPLR